MDRKTRLAISLHQQGEFAEVEALARSVVDDARSEARKDHAEYDTALRLLVGSLWAQPERFLDAVPTIQELEARYRADDDPRLALMLYLRGHSQILRDEYAQAETTLREAVQRMEESGHPGLGDCRWALAGALANQQKLEEALDIQRRLLSWLRETGQSTRVASVLAMEAETSLKRGEYSSAESQARQCLEIRTQLEPDSWVRYNAMSLLGGALAGQGKYEEAEPLLLEGFEKMVVPPDVIAPRKRQALERIVQLYEAWGRADDAAKWRSKLEEGR